MKLPNDFAAFLRDTVNLNQTRLDNLESSTTALKNFLREQELGIDISTFYGQGSWAHKTIIKPVDGGEFDADLLVIVHPVDGWTAKQYVDELHKAFCRSDTYKEKVQRFRYCVTITYAGDRKVDIAPCVKERLWKDTYEVCNRDSDAFEASAPITFTEWITERNGYSGKNSFRKVTRLLKYLRDIKGRFVCPSILLTTLIGNQIDWWDKNTPDFADTPTTLQTVMGRLDDWLQAREQKPKVPNPKLSSEDFAADWTDTQYSNFRNMIHKYRGWVDDACAAGTRNDSIKAWRRLFGDEFAKGEDVAALVKAAQESGSVIQSLMLSTAAHLDTLVDDVLHLGRSFLPSAFYRPPYLKVPPWATLGEVSRNVQVSATHHANREAATGRPISRGEGLPRSGGVWFKAYVNGYNAVPDGFRVEWRITNTGVEALLRQAGRGGFYHCQRPHSRWETLEYRGVHLAQAFIIRMSDEVLVGQSEPFEVVIQ